MKKTFKKIPPLYKKINKRSYSLVALEKTKKEIQEEKKYTQQFYKSVRIIKLEDGYALYVWGKK